MSSLTPAALQERVRRATRARRAERVERIQRLWSGYGEIARYRLEGSRQPSAVVKHVCPPALPQHPRNWASPAGHTRKLRSYAVEQAFYQRWAPALRGTPCRVPEAFELSGPPQAAAEASRQGPGAPGGGELEWLFVLEDLDASGFRLRLPKPALGPLRACLRWLASFHGYFLARAPADLWPTGTYWHLATRAEELARQKPGGLKSAAARLDARLAATRYPTLLHGDAKVANFCFASEVDCGAVAAVDFQYTGVGCGMKDVAYFFSSCLNAEECEALVPQLLGEYFVHLRSALAQREGPLDAAAVEADWRALYPLAWADFQRFLEGWAPDHSKLHDYCQRMTLVALRSL